MNPAHRSVLPHTSELTKALLERMVLPALMVVSIFLFGTVGFLIVGDGKWGLFDCAYMTSITLTTVGYGEMLDNMGRNGRLFCMVLMWTGMGVTLYSVSAITGFVVEQNLSRLLRERKMEKRIAALKNHYIVCGAGKTGFNVSKELVTSGRPCVIIELKPERIEWMRKQFEGICFIQGDATEEDVLKRAGIERAAGVLAVLGEDSYNLLITVQTRYTNPDIKIVARCHENNLADKFYRAGANYVVNPAFIGGIRMASEMVRPNVVSFLDRMLRGKDKSVRVEEVTVCETSPWVGHSLRELCIHDKTGLIPISIKHPEDDDFKYNPSSDEVLKPGTVVIVIGNPEQVSKLDKFCSPRESILEEIIDKITED
ncbi:MAG: potassium channel protein [Syntrophobacteraceae bacterium]